MAEVAKEIGVSFSCDEISNFIQFNPVEYELKKQEQTLQYDSFEVEQFFLTLPKGTAGTYRNFFRKASTVENEGKIELLLNKITDEEIITFILGYRE